MELDEKTISFSSEELEMSSSKKSPDEEQETNSTTPPSDEELSSSFSATGPLVSSLSLSPQLDKPPQNTISNPKKALNEYLSKKCIVYL
ncbi:hypothetical protein [Fibrobacter sp. UWB5]|uniref:hypothetical protein n=1 Tax=Fibrobacter sp. UWB5 TaxID=1964360 RepID=UPI001303C845|nr:hypothetical protein [Fibrobacter sp. UWB5]